MSVESTDVVSPCIRQCCLDDNDVCLGCFRTLDEILAWQQSTASEKQTVILRSQERKIKSEESKY